jgi:hypothetical protein
MPVLAVKRQAPLNGPHGVPRFIKVSLRNAPTNCMSYGDDKKAGI